MSNKEKFYPEALFGGFTDIDGTVAFFNRVNSLLDPSFVVLDVGCGRGAYSEDPIAFRKNLRILKGKVSRVIGIDVDSGAKDNPFVDEFRLIEGDNWPIDNNSIDLIICDNVLEHIPNPDKLFQQISRVLRNGGYLCLRTPNRWSYIAIAATLVPNKYHSKVTSVVQSGRKGEDVFPTVYKCNSIPKIKNIMTKNGFESVVYSYEAEPSYLSFSTIAYFLGVIHQKLAPGFIKPAIFAFGKMNKETA
jgi:SAM-dependent methyltransferase